MLIDRCAGLAGSAAGLSAVALAAAFAMIAAAPPAAPTTPAWSAAGAVMPLDERAELIASPDGRVNYVQHTREGAILTGDGVAEWTFEWRAPNAEAS